MCIMLIKELVFMAIYDEHWSSEWVYAANDQQKYIAIGSHY